MFKKIFIHMMTIIMATVCLSVSTFAAGESIEFIQYDDGILIKSDILPGKQSVQIGINLKKNISQVQFDFESFPENTQTQITTKDKQLIIYIDSPTELITSKNIGFLTYSNHDNKDIDSTSVVVVNKDFDKETIQTQMLKRSVSGSYQGSDAGVGKTHIIGISTQGKGSIEPNGGTDNKLSVTKYEDQQFTIKPNKGYMIADVLIDGKSIGAVSRHTFKNVQKDHTIKAIFLPINPFVDISKEDWFFESVLTAYEKGMMTGTSKNTFEPNLGASRGMIATILHRMEGSPKPSIANPFNDVQENEWYTAAITWMAQQGIIEGYGNNIFKLNKTITREELCAILYRYAEYKGLDTTKKANLNSFKDANEIGSWAKDSVAFVVAQELMGGKGNNIFDPKGIATRAEVAAILTRFTTK